MNVRVPEAVKQRDTAEQGVRGTQSVRRALSLLRLVARSSDQGVRLAKLVDESGLDRGTAYRLLTCMLEEQFISRGSDHAYRLGPQSVLLGSLFSQPLPVVNHFMPAMKRISRVACDTVFLLMRQGDLVQCVHREEGSALVKVLTTYVGQRRLLGTGTGGVALLGLIDDAEIVEIHKRNAAEYAAHEIDAARLLAMAHAVRATDLALTFDALEVGVAGAGMAFRMGEHGMGGLSIATLTARFGPERQHMLGDVLRTELRGLGLRD